jgi:predicted DsbA family dithiol-disulfide isomerase
VGSGAGTRLSAPYDERRVRIDVWFDYACPWCALGLARLGVALADFEHGDEVEVVHRAFELDRHAPAQVARTQEEILARKYGLSPAQVRTGHAGLTALGAEVGFAFDFEHVRSGSTFDAHRLTRAAGGTVHEAALVAGLFVAHFGEGRQLSDHAVLRDVARAAGVPEDLTEKVLRGTVGSAEVRADEATALERDVTGVPFFLIDGAWPVPGAQDVETLGIVLRRAWSRFGH